jgi:hypothetical protein
MDGGSGTSYVAVGMRLARLARDLSALRSDLQSITPKLRERIFIRLGTRIYQEQQRLRKLQEDFDNDRDKESMWAAVTSFEQSLHELFEECLALIEGAAVRELEGPGLFCSMADAIVDDILTNIDMEWRAFTVPATSEFFSGSSRVIRVRYPSMSVWDLPIVAHELGHFVGPALSSYRGDHIERPFEKLMDVTATAEQADRLEIRAQAARLNEIFADMFAAYVCGPAYLLSCILLRFNPVDAARASFRYPADHDRVVAIAEVINRLPHESDTMDRRMLDEAVSYGIDAWRDALLSFDSTSPDADSKYALPRIIDILEEYLPFARFSGFRQSSLIAHLLSESLGTSDEFALPKDTRPIHLLNGAWMVRLRNPDQSDEIGHFARQALMQSG